MEKYKVYISKSKQSDFNELLKLKSDLARFKHIEVLEFQGGTYTPDLLLSADTVIFLPPKDAKLIMDSTSQDCYTMGIGRGQFEEFEKAIKRVDCFLYDGGDYLDIVEASKHGGYSNWQNYGELKVLFEALSSNQIFNDRLEVSIDDLICEHNEPKIINDKKKLLISYGRSNS